MNDILVVGILAVVMVILAWVAGTAVAGGLIMWTWNVLVPVTKLATITYWQAVAGSIALQVVGGLLSNMAPKKSS